MDKEEIIKLINTYWRFDDDQDSTSSWHDKQALILEIEQPDTPVVVSPKVNSCICDKMRREKATAWWCGVCKTDWV